MVKNKGITLIALIITIIILLILAGVTINLILGENGLFNTAKQAGIEYEKAQLKEELEIEIANIQSKRYAEGKEFTREDLKELANIDATVESTETPAEGEYKNYYFEIDEKYNVTIIGKLRGKKPTIQAEIIDEEIGEIKVTAQIEEGTIQTIEATNGAILKTNISAAEKIYIVNTNGTYDFKAIAENGRSANIRIKINTIEETVWTNNTTANRTIDGTTPTYRNPIIPVGFSAINTETSKWNKDNGVSSEWNNGLVIKNATDGNEFVWVPVDEINVKYEKWCTTNISYVDCSDIASSSGLDIASNVIDYGGFWVARYEAGLPTSINQTTNVAGKPLSVAGAVPWNRIELSNAKANAESMYSNNYVQSGLINGTQWDTLIKWLQNGGYDVIKSTDWGNYLNSTLTLKGRKYTYISADYGTTWTTATSTMNGTSQLIKTGASNGARAKNIYDLAGNLWEWTCEQYSSYVVIRGGSCGSDYSVAYRYKLDANAKNDRSTGFRVQLYIK